MSAWVSIQSNDFLNQCSCGSCPSLYTYFIHGIANHRNYLVSCACGRRTRTRRTVIGAVEDWNSEFYAQKRERDK